MPISLSVIVNEFPSLLKIVNGQRYTHTLNIINMFLISLNVLSMHMYIAFCVCIVHFKLRMLIFLNVCRHIKLLCFDENIEIVGSWQFIS